jgi:hypothetical protein
MLHPVDLMAGASGTVTVTVTDSLGAEDGADVMVEFYVTLPAGALLAVPVDLSASVDDPVTVVVLSGDFRADAPFHYCDGVGVTVNEGADYAVDSFNVGAPGGDPDEPDGIWATMDPVPSGYTLPPGFFFDAQPTQTPGIVRMDFLVSPIGGSEVTDGGALFNFGLTFDHPGTYTLGFQLFEDVRRTFYSDSESETYEWPEISNHHPGIPNTITVVEAE